MNVNQIKIAIVGSHGVGKTTLIKELVEKGEFDCEEISGIPRQIIKRGFPMGKNSTVDSYVNYINDQFKAQRLATMSIKPLIISDRTTLDATAYARVNSLLPRPAVPQYFIDMLHEVWLKEVAFFDIIAFIPVEFPMQSDGVRDEGDEYREAISFEIERILKSNNTKYAIIKGSVEERLVLLSSQIKSMI